MNLLVGLLVLISLLLPCNAYGKVDCVVGIKACNTDLLATRAELAETQKQLQLSQKSEAELRGSVSPLPWWTWILLGAAGAIVVQGVAK